MKYANFDNENKILGWYDKEIHGTFFESGYSLEEKDEDGNILKESELINEGYWDLSKIPTPVIEVEDKIWEEAIIAGHNKVNEDGTTEYFDFRTEADIINENEEKAKFKRDNAEVSNIKVHEAEWQVKDVDRTRIKETIDTAYRQNRAEETINWILADNTIRASTVKDLEDVLDAFSLRREDIFTQYAIWRNGDKTTLFVYEN